MIYGDRTTTFDDFLKKNNDEYIKTLMSIDYIDRMVELATTANSCYILFRKFTEYDGFGYPHEYYDFSQINYLDETNERLYFAHQVGRERYTEIKNGLAEADKNPSNPGDMYMLIPFENCSQQAAEIILEVYLNGIHHSLSKEAINKIPHKIRKKALVSFAEKNKISENALNALSKYFQIRGAAISRYSIYVEST